MSKVTRYMGWGNLGLVENVNGGLVKYSDYRALAAECERLREALGIYAAVYNEHWKPGMPILEPISDSALAAESVTGAGSHD